MERNLVFTRFSAGFKWTGYNSHTPRLETRGGQGNAVIINFQSNGCRHITDDFIAAGILG
jgi:hypothetical protein